jgi:hypothetical protein
MALAVATLMLSQGWEAGEVQRPDDVQRHNACHQRGGQAEHDQHVQEPERDREDQDGQDRHDDACQDDIEDEFVFAHRSGAAQGHQATSIEKTRAWVT